MFQFGDIGKYILALHDTPQERYLALEMDKVSISSGQSAAIKYEKLNFETISTEKIPCTDDKTYDTDACLLQQKEKVFVDKYNCRFPFMEQLTINQTQVCTEDLKEKEKFWNAGNFSKENCPFVQRCTRSMIKMYDKLENTAPEGSSYVKISINTQYIQLVQDQYSYDMQSFIGEVGGTLGLMLGYSFMSLIDFIENTLKVVRRKLSMLGKKSLLRSATKM